MKKYLALALACLLMLMGAAAFAEENAAAETVDLHTHLLEVGFSEEESAAIHDALVGEWYTAFIGMNSGWGWDLFDAEDLYAGYKMTISEDGTAVMYDFRQDPLSWTVKIAGKGIITENYAGDTFETPVTEIQFCDPESGTWQLKCFLTEEAYSTLAGYGTPGWSMSSSVAQGLNVYFTKSVDFAGEPAPIRTDAPAEEFNGKWELAAADFMGRTIHYYDLREGRTEPGMICEIDLDAGYCAINYVTSPWQASSMENAEDGSLIASNPEFENRSTVTFSLREDDTLYVQHHGLNMTFQRFVIDPLTEYNDRDTIQRVQSAMNSLGYECGTPDGIAGKKTAAAISAFQTDSGLTVTGTITEETLQFLKSHGAI